MAICAPEIGDAVARKGGLTKPKSSLSTLQTVMGASERKPRIGFSQGRGKRKDHGARLAAIGTPNRQFQGTADTNGADHGSEPGNSSAAA